MFVYHCSSCDKRQLIFPSQATGVTETARGLALSFTCWCGATQTVDGYTLDQPVAA